MLDLILHVLQLDLLLQVLNMDVIKLHLMQAIQYKGLQ